MQPQLRSRRRAFAFSVSGVVALLLGLAYPGVLLIAKARPAAAAAIAYPDVRVQVPTSEISIGSTGGRRYLEFSHVTWNAGAGPLEIRPTYDPTTGMATAVQALYTASLAFVTTVPIVKPMTRVEPDDYEFPFSQFGLHAVTSGGGVGALIAPSPKVDFCMTPDDYVGGVPNTPNQTAYSPSNCGSPDGTLGLDVGWGDKYDFSDNGENIDITSVPDGTYWLRAIADPYHYFQESDPSNNVTDTEVQITGNTVTVLQQATPSITPPAVTMTAPAAQTTASGTVTLSASVSDATAVWSVQFLLDGEPIGPAVTTAPYTMQWPVGSTVPGTHLLSAQALDANGMYGTAAPVAVTVPQTVGSMTIDVDTQVTGTGSVTTTPISTTTAGEVLLAFVGSDGVGQTATVSGGGLAWTLVERNNTRPGDTEIWTATAPAALSNVTITSQPTLGGFDEQLTVVGLRGASGVGASAAASAASGTPTVQLSATAAGSVAFAVGNDFDNAIARTVGAGQALVSQFVDTRTGDTYWVQDTTAASTHASQSITLDDSAPTADQWNLAAVEVVPGNYTPDTTPPTVSIANPIDGHVVSGVDVPVAALASDNVAVVSVQFLLDGKPLGLPLVAPYAYAWDTTTVPNGSHQLGATAVDPSGNVGTATPVTIDVENPAPPMVCFIVDAKVSKKGRNRVTVHKLHTGEPGELLLAFVEADGPVGGAQSVTVTTAGLTWTLVARANAQTGDAEIWEATAPSVLTKASVKSTPAIRGYDQAVTVIALQGTNGTGASAVASAASGAPTAGVTTTQSNSLVFATGIDSTAATARTAGSNQLLLAQYLDTRATDVFWVQQTTAQAGPAGSVVTVSDTAPTSDAWNLAVVEVIGAAE